MRNLSVPVGFVAALSVTTLCISTPAVAQNITNNPAPKVTIHISVREIVVHDGLGRAGFTFAPTALPP